MSKDNNEVQTTSMFLEKHIGSMLTALVISFIVGTTAMIYSSDKANKVLETKLTFISLTMNDLKNHIKLLEGQIRAGVKDRWTRVDHREFERRNNQRIMKLEDRVFKLEVMRRETSQ